jgi:hypothetical protein
MLNNFFTIGVRAKNSIDRVQEVIPKEFKNKFIFDLQHKFHGQTVANSLILDLKCLYHKKCSDYQPHISHDCSYKLAVINYFHYK